MADQRLNRVVQLQAGTTGMEEDVRTLADKHINNGPVAGRQSKGKAPRYGWHILMDWGQSGAATRAGRQAGGRRAGANRHACMQEGGYRWTARGSTTPTHLVQLLAAQLVSVLHHLKRGNGLPEVAALAPHAPLAGSIRLLQLLERATRLTLVVPDAPLDLLDLLAEQLQQAEMVERRGWVG